MEEVVQERPAPEKTDRILTSVEDTPIGGEIWHKDGEEKRVTRGCQVLQSNSRE